MSTAFLAAIALVLSGCAIFLLCLGDPKRRRAAGGRAGGMTPARRRLIVALACAPGLICAMIGDAAAFLIWLGGCALAGWALAVCFRPNSTAR